MLMSKQEKEKRKMWLNKWKMLHQEENLQRQNLGGDEEEEEYYYESNEDLIDVCEEVVPF